MSQINLDIWSDQNISAGDNWANLIEENLRKSEIVLLFISPRALASEWVMMEFGAAVALKKKIIPVVLKDTHIPSFLSEHKYIRANSINEAAEKIKETLCKIAEQDASADEKKSRR